MMQTSLKCNQGVWGATDLGFDGQFIPCLCSTELSTFDPETEPTRCLPGKRSNWPEGAPRHLRGGQ